MPRGAALAVIAITVAVSASASAETSSSRGSDLPGTPITDPDFDPPVTAATHPVRAPQQKILYVNFDGALLEDCGPGVDDPVGNCSTIFTGPVVPYSGDVSARAAVVQALRQDLADFDVVVTTERPRGDVAYDMEMVGDWYPPINVGFAGIAPKIDCFDAAGGDVSFTLEGDRSPHEIAKIILQEVAHTWGLEHVDAPGDLLYPTTGGAADPRFEARCSPIVRLGGGLILSEARCPEQHAEHCAEPDHQASHADILALFGPAPVDAEPPTLAILSPADGEHAPNDFHLVFEIVDTIVPQTYATTIEIDELYSTDLALVGPGVFPVSVAGLPDGHFTVTVTARDEAGNEASTQIEIDVGAGAPDEGSDTTDGTPPQDATTGAPDGGTESTDTDTTGDPMNSGGGDDGCGCRSAAAPRWSSAAILATLTLLGGFGRCRRAR